MATSALRPRKASEIVDAAFQILKAHYSQFVMCSALAYLPWLLIELLWLGNPEKLAGRLADAESIAGASWLMGLMAGFGVWIAFALMSAVIMTCASQAYLGETIDVERAVRWALPRLPRVMVAAVLRYVLLVAGFLCFLVGALYVAARLFALTPTIILEDASISQAFSRTSVLSDGRKQHILSTLGLVAIIYWVIAAGVSFMGAMSGNFVVRVVLGAFYTILAYPVIAITECLLYYDARIQSEGLDIELMAQELGATAPTGPANR
ncbi:MAG: hypothetical protein ABI969_12725 [bacterium]